MILKDIIDDYQFVDSKLIGCKDYFDKCQAVIDSYFQNMSVASTKYFNSGLNDSARSAFTAEVATAMTKCFSLITLLNSSAFTFYSCLGVLTSRKYSLSLLEDEVSAFHSAAQVAITSTNNIIVEQLDGMKRKNLLEPFINSLQELLHIYHSLVGRNHLLSNVEQELWEPLPNEVSTNDFVTFELRSYKASHSLDEYATDLSLLSSFISQFEMLMERQDNPTTVYLRKFESGSLRIVWESNIIEINSIAEIIKALTDGIRTFRLTSVEKRLQKEQLRKDRLENDEKELAIINSQISTICSRLDLSKDRPEDVETIQRLCLPLVRYINNNPVGKIGNQKYDITSEVKLLEDFYFNKPNMPNED